LVKSAILQPSARPVLIEYSTAFLFITGNVPGRPSTCSSTAEFGSGGISPARNEPLALATDVNIFVRVASCT